jgi:hypothetical protein
MYKVHRGTPHSKLLGTLLCHLNGARLLNQYGILHKPVLFIISQLHGILHVHPLLITGNLAPIQIIRQTTIKSFITKDTAVNYKHTTVKVSTRISVIPTILRILGLDSASHNCVYHVFIIDVAVKITEESDALDTVDNVKTIITVKMTIATRRKTAIRITTKLTLAGYQPILQNLRV